jgi:hypothetical protein
LSSSRWISPDAAPDRTNKGAVASEKKEIKERCVRLME